MEGGFKAPEMGKTLLVLLATFALTDTATVFDAFSASVGGLFTKQAETPFTVVKKAADYEERKYGATKWVCASGTDLKESSSHQQETFLKLFSYIEGEENAEGIKIAMAIPVSVEYSHKNLEGSPLLSACFYLGDPYQTEDPPAPKDKTLSIVTREPMTIFTRKIGGFLNKPREWLKEVKSLTDKVTKDGEKVRRDLMFWNAFDSPVKFWNRRNEVWLLKENEQQ